MSAADEFLKEIKEEKSLQTHRNNYRYSELLRFRSDVAYHFSGLKWIELSHPPPPHGIHFTFSFLNCSFSYYTGA